MRIPFAEGGDTYNDTQIEDRLAGCIERDSGKELHIGPSSMDLHVYPEKLKIEGGHKFSGGIDFDISSASEHPEVTKLTEQYPIRVGPGEFCLVRSDERLDLPAGVMALMEGRSSIGRLGLFVENAGLVDRGFAGTLTLELYNPTDNKITIPAQTRLAQLLFIEQGGSEETAYDGKYQGQVGATASRAYEDE